MDFTGYMIRGSVSGGLLRVEGTTKVSRAALAGPDQDRPVILALEEIDSVRVKRPRGWRSWLVNGLVDIHARDGKRYQLHFRKKHFGDLDRLRAALGA